MFLMIYSKTLICEDGMIKINKIFTATNYVEVNRKELEALEAERDEAVKNIDACRDYLMEVKPNEMDIIKILNLLGFDSTGTEGE